MFVYCFLKNKVNFFFLFSPLWRFFNLNNITIFFFFYIPINPKKKKDIEVLTNMARLLHMISGPFVCMYIS